jgi:hypothetical protein
MREIIYFEPRTGTIYPDQRIAPTSGVLELPSGCLGWLRAQVKAAALGKQGLIYSHDFVDRIRSWQTAHRRQQTPLRAQDVP